VVGVARVVGVAGVAGVAGTPTNMPSYILRHLGHPNSTDLSDRPNP
jgi:hypothetical protein